MDNAYFLITDIQAEDGAHQILHSLTCAQINAEVVVFVKDFERLKSLREEFPSAIFILLDLTKNVDVNKGCLRLLPEMDCFLNFSGEPFAMITKQGDTVKISRDCEIACSSLSLEEISVQLSKNENVGSVLINILPEANGGSGSCFSGKKDQDPPYGFSGSPVRFQVGSKLAKSSTAIVPGSERMPLLASARLQQEPEPGFLACLFCFCYPYCGTGDTGPTKFDSPEQLMNHIRLEQTAEMRRCLETLFETTELEWNKILKQLEYKEQKKIEELVSKVADKKSQEETELNQEKDAQNATTTTNLSDVLPEKTIQKIKESRERQSKKKVRHDTEQSYREGSVLINRAAEMERVISKDENYSKVLLKQFDILTNIKEKYKRKLERLMEKNFPKVKNA